MIDYKTIKNDLSVSLRYLLDEGVLYPSDYADLIDRILDTLHRHVVCSNYKEDRER